MGYIQEMRKQVGAAPLIMVGACVLIFDKEKGYFSNCETIMVAGDLPGAPWILEKALKK